MRCNLRKTFNILIFCFFTGHNLAKRINSHPFHNLRLLICYSLCQDYHVQRREAGGGGGGGGGME